MYTQGLHPQLDFSDIDAVRKVVEECNQLPVHPRHPYVGDLVPYRFLRLAPGCHSQGLRPAEGRRDLGSAIPADRSGRHRPRLRSGDPGQQPVRQGGITFLLEQEYGISLSRRMQIEFSQVVQGETDRLGLEMTAQQIYSLLENEYLKATSPHVLASHRLQGRERHQRRRPGSLLRRREAALARDRQGTAGSLGGRPAGQGGNHGLP